MYEFAFVVACAVFVGWLIGQLTGGVMDRAMLGLRVLIGGWRKDDWPRGIQEEDFDRPWGHATDTYKPAPTPWVEPSAAAVATRRVKPETHASARTIGR
jgi:hypothetical protein